MSARARTSSRSTITPRTRSSNGTRTAIRRARSPEGAGRVVAFPPLLGTAPRLLILGSLPGVASLEAGEYYAHPRNLFWDLMGELFGAGRELPYAERCRHLTDEGVAVWDVLHAAARPGSLDADIDFQTMEINDFRSFIEVNSTLRAIAFNGGTAARLFRRRVLPTLADLPAARDLVMLPLPSTSPAHAGRSRAQKLAAWGAIAPLALAR